jgi:hypothetical protein
VTTPELPNALAALRDALAGLRLGLDLPGAAGARRERADLVRQVEEYLLPRLRRLDAPLLAVVGGSTGAGKSTLLNTLLGEQVSPAGVLRPTTRAPVLVCNPQDLHWFSADRVLSGLPRTTGPAERGAGGGSATLRLVPHAAMPAGMAILDAPDIDSVVATNRALATQLLDAADLWIFLTTAARYADAVPWDLLHTAEQRGTALAVVLNRVPPDAAREVGPHLAGMLADNGLTRAALFAVPESVLTDGRIPAPAVAPVRQWLDRLGRDSAARAEIVRTTLSGALQSIRARVLALAGHAEEQLAAASALRRDVAERYAAALRQVDDSVRGGALLRGEVLDRWQEYVGTGELMRTLQARIGQLRDRLAAAFTGRPAPGTELRQAVESSLESLVRAAAERAAEQSAQAWRARPAGAALLGTGPGALVRAGWTAGWTAGASGSGGMTTAGGTPGGAPAGPGPGTARELARTSPGFGAALEREVRGWQGRVLDLVANQGSERRAAARLASFSVNGAGLVLMLAVFAHTGGLTGAEVAVAGGTSAVSQKVLEAVFGDTAVRTLAAQARTDLIERVEAMLEAEAARFTALVDAAAPAPPAAAAVRDALARFEQVRRAARLGGPPADPAPARTTR